MSSTHLPQKLADFLAHWRALKRQTAAPTLSDFLDSPVPALQPWVSIFDVKEKNLVLRLFGTGMVGFTGVDFTGKTLDDFAAPEGRAALYRPYLDIARKPCGSLTSSLWVTSTGRSVEIRSIGLPLFRKGGHSVAWLNDLTASLNLGETGMLIQRTVAQEWIDLGHGVPGR